LLAGELLPFAARFHCHSNENHLPQFVAQLLSLFCVGRIAETPEELLKFSPLRFLGPDSGPALTDLLLWGSHDISMHQELEALRVSFGNRIDELAAKRTFSPSCSS
jgi:hypothetical protein